ncbi:hypothetical protein ACIHFE_06910 [Streptomyces sp. NPDC052396]|uniref:hypothetical protein n=1 Tax=Streptomyces sp. NPDC052396 TaxID=3365689 RepID=UPI0037D5F712
MRDQANGPADTSSHSTAVRCTQCTKIKEMWREADRRNDVRVAETMTVAMGRHLRAAHG